MQEARAVTEGVGDRETRVGQINLYTCEGTASDRVKRHADGAIEVIKAKGCGRSTVTRDVDDGVTPMMLRCDCGGDQVSAFYNCDQTLTPSAEWYRPNTAQVTRLPRGIAQHVREGGLVLRAIGTGRDAIVGERPTPPPAPVDRRTAVERTLAAMHDTWDWNEGRKNQARAFVKRAKKSAARRRIEKATRRRMRR